jgi:hypothetical protein
MSEKLKNIVNSVMWFVGAGYSRVFVSSYLEKSLEDAFNKPGSPYNIALDNAIQLIQVNKEQAEKIESLQKRILILDQEIAALNRYQGLIKDNEDLKADKYYMAARIKGAQRFLNEALSARGLNDVSSFPKVAGEKTGEFNGR